MPKREEIPKLVGIVLAKSPKVVLKLSWRFLKAKKKAQRAEAIFIKRMEATGMDRETAKKLAERYTSTVSLRKMIKELGIPGSVMKGIHGNNGKG
jgi:hypothetical protein